MADCPALFISRLLNVFRWRFRVNNSCIQAHNVFQALLLNLWHEFFCQNSKAWKSFHCLCWWEYNWHVHSSRLWLILADKRQIFLRLHENLRVFRSGSVAFDCDFNWRVFKGGLVHAEDEHASRKPTNGIWNSDHVASRLSLSLLVCLAPSSFLPPYTLKVGTDGGSSQPFSTWHHLAITHTHTHSNAHNGLPQFAAARLALLVYLGFLSGQ